MSSYKLLSPPTFLSLDFIFTREERRGERYHSERMDAKITTVRPREEDWLGRALATQLEMEEIWQSVEGEDGYRMRPLSPHSLDSGDSGGVRLVCLSDTHSLQSSIEFRIPDGDILTLRYQSV